jgi:hypothetical protein
MARIQLNDRYHRGVAVFERDGDYATLTFQTTKNIPATLQYELEGERWRITYIKSSDYVEGVLTLGLERING